jgi:hypothetical protein
MVGIFDQLVNLLLAPMDKGTILLPLHLLSDLPPLPSSKPNVQYIQTVCGCGGGGGC